LKIVRLDLDRVLETLRRGVRRADVFMGIGLNAAEQTPPPSHILAPETGHTLHLVKQELTEAETAHVAAEFGKWVRANGLRELMETFSIYMHELYAANFVLLKFVNKLGDLARVSPARFERMGIGDQIKTLSQAIAVSGDDIDIVMSLNRCRNCYAHRRGVVGENDIDASTGVFILCWVAFQIEIAEPNGNIIPEVEIYGRVLESGGTLQMRLVKRTRQYARGAELVMNKRELKEICLCIFLIGQHLLRATVALAKEEGVFTEKTDDNLTAAAIV
jgi:hypothetical protein